MGHRGVQGMFADARAVTVRFKKKNKQQNLLNSVGAASRPSVNLLGMVIPWHTGCECLKMAHGSPHQPLPRWEPAALAKLSRLSVSSDIFILGRLERMLNCWFAPSCVQALSSAVQRGPGGGCGSVPVTLPALAGGRKCLNLGQSLTDAFQGGSGFLFVREWDRPVVFRKACETRGSSLPAPAMEN